MPVIDENTTVDIDEIDEELRRLKLIMRHVQKLSPAGMHWLVRRIQQVELPAAEAPATDGS